MKLLLPRCLKAWALDAAAAAAEWAEKEVGASGGGKERLGRSPVQAPAPRTRIVVDQVAKGQAVKVALVKGHSVDHSTAGWFQGGSSASSPTEPAGACSLLALHSTN